MIVNLHFKGTICTSLPLEGLKVSMDSMVLQALQAKDLCVFASSSVPPVLFPLLVNPLAETQVLISPASTSPELTAVKASRITFPLAVAVSSLPATHRC